MVQVAKTANKVTKKATLLIKQLLRPAKRYIEEKSPRNSTTFPIELQLPITYKCNFDCVMCGMRNLINQDHLSPSELGNILSDPLFSKVEHVGINGGEPFLRQDLVECVDAVITSLSELSAIYLISNGYFTERICKLLKPIKAHCSSRNIKVNLALSIDGVGDMQDFMRGKEGSYTAINNTVNALQANLESYCDQLTGICTITKHNIERIGEVELWASLNQIEVSYNIATEHKRIANADKVGSFSILHDDKAKMLAREFFFKQYHKTHNEKYMALFLFLSTGKRMSSCLYQKCRGVTLNPDGGLAYCATYSDVVGNACEVSALSLFRSNSHYHDKLCQQRCSVCSHYMYQLDSVGEYMLVKKKKMNLKNRLYASAVKCLSNSSLEI